MAEQQSFRDPNLEGRIFFRRAMVMLVLILLMAVILVMRLLYLQVSQHEKYFKLADNNRIHSESVPPTRGLIFDRNGVLIADNVPSHRLVIVKEQVKDIDQTLAQLASILPLSKADIKSFKRRLKQRRRPYEPVHIRTLTEQEIALVAVNKYRLPGVDVSAQLVRHYPYKSLLAHAVGSVRRINARDKAKLDPTNYSGTYHMGKTGVERHYEAVLHGTVGTQTVETNALNRVIRVLDREPPKAGKDLILHLDIALQQQALAALGDKRGAIVAISPEDGGILAMVSNPAYDPNAFVTGISGNDYRALTSNLDLPLFNRAQQGLYSPGSTIKPVLGLAGLKEGIVSPSFAIKDPGYFKLPNNSLLYRDWNWTKRGTGGHGTVNLRKAIYRSCNVYFYSLAVKLGIDRIDNYLGQFGLGQKLVLDLPEASAGLLPTVAWKKRVRRLPWYPGDTVNMGIGQGDTLVSPLQLATLAAILANRGKAVYPRMLKQVVQDKQTTQQYLGKAVPDLGISLDRQEDWDYVLNAMGDVVHRGNKGFGENGTAWAYMGQRLQYRMAGKSGTAQAVGIKQGEEYDEEKVAERNRDHAWFIAFAPLDKPKIALAVLVENGGGGSSVAGPVARKVLDEYMLRDEG